MSSKQRLWSVLILIMGGLTSCTSGNSPSEPPIHSIQPESTATAITSPESVITSTPIPTPTATVTPEVIQKSYQMNKNYFIVPKVDSDSKKIVLLTFDDGPKEKAMIDEIINILDRHKAKAIFFVNGYRIKQNPDLLKLIVDRGQIIGNHAWDHINLKKESNETVTKQIMDVQEIVKQLTGQT
ncbi:MAG TPA: polysaccharide deacetylase family protein, partial [Bacilli bacterium]